MSYVLISKNRNANLPRTLQIAIFDLRCREAEGQAAHGAVDEEEGDDEIDMDDDDIGDDDGNWETEEEDEEEEDEAMNDGAAGPAKDDEEFRKRYNLDDYDNDDDEEEVADVGMGGTRIQGAGMGNGLSGLAYHASNKDDPFITLKDEDDDEEEIDDYRIRPQDNLIVVGQTEDVYSHLVVNGTLIQLFCLHQDSFSWFGGYHVVKVHR